MTDDVPAGQGHRASVRGTLMLEIDLGAVAHRAMWGYGSIPPWPGTPPSESGSRPAGTRAAIITGRFWVVARSQRTSKPASPGMNALVTAIFDLTRGAAGRTPSCRLRARSGQGRGLLPMTVFAADSTFVVCNYGGASVLDSAGDGGGGEARPAFILLRLPRGCLCRSVSARSTRGYTGIGGKDGAMDEQYPARTIAKWFIAWAERRAGRAFQPQAPEAPVLRAGPPHRQVRVRAVRRRDPGLVTWPCHARGLAGVQEVLRIADPARR